jgi:beta-propeller repeat-containing protein
MKTKIKLFQAPRLLAVALAILGHTTSQAQLGGVPLWTNHYSSGTAYAVAVDGSGNVVVAGGSEAPNWEYVTIKFSGAGVPLWVNHYGFLASVSAIAVDGSGNVFVTGNSSGSGSGYDYATIAYSGAGVPLWTNIYNGPGNSDLANAVAVDGSANVFVTGQSFGSGSGLDYATIKYSGAGVPLWTNRYNGPGNGDDYAVAVAVDGSGNAFVTGYSTGSGGGYEYATIKYSGAGVPLWTNLYNGPLNSAEAFGMAVDASGNVVVTGYDGDYATIKYSGAGLPLWTNRYDGPGNATDGANAIAVDGAGSVFVTGSSTGTNSHSDCATIKYSGAGVPLWTNRYGGPGNTTAGGGAIAVDGAGNVFVTGTSSSGPGVEPTEYATIGYSGAGVPLWTNRYQGYQTSIARAVAVDGGGNVFVTGSYWSGFYDAFATIKYSSAIPPSLNVARTTTNTVALSWPSPSTGFTLQQTTNGLATVNWSNVVATPSDDGTTKTVIVDPPTGNRFYRLVHP